MIQPVMRFILMLVLALLAGAMFGVWLGFDPARLSASAYVEMQQTAIRGMNVVMPLMGLACILMSATLAFLSKTDRVTRSLFSLAAALLLVAGAITRFGNQPINALVMTWNAATPPPEWSALRDHWWHLHVIRTVVSIAALAAALLAILRSGSRSA